jgi:hypothetical protein
MLVAALLLLAPACRAKLPAIDQPFHDAFDRPALGADWLDTGAGYGISGGRVTVTKAYNHPLWLRRRLPRDVVIEFDAMSTSPDGDLKVELYGDGESFDPDGNRYEATGYVLCFGAHRNAESFIGRLGEHEAAIKAYRPADPRVEAGRVYHWTITRKDGRVDWQIDGKPYLAFIDKTPLFGDGHEFFAFNDWVTEVHFDNLTIRPAP